MMKNVIKLLFVVGISSGAAQAVDLYLSNKTNRDLLVTIWDESSPLKFIGVGGGHQLVGPLTDGDALRIYWASDDTPEPALWGSFRITLGGQREEEIRLTVAGNPCDGFQLQDVLNEPGEGGYNIQTLHEESQPSKNCPLR